MDGEYNSYAVSSVDILEVFSAENKPDSATDVGTYSYLYIRVRYSNICTFFNRC